MYELLIVYWKDIPAQVIVRKGRRSVASRKLPERFEQAIDRCAMKVGAEGSDAYLSEWRKVVIRQLTDEEDPEVVAENESERLDKEFTQDKIIEIISNCDGE